MITQIINDLLGPLGRELLAFYTRNSAIINGLIVLYGLILFLCNQNFNAIQKKAKVIMVKIPRKNLSRITWKDVLVLQGGNQFVANVKSWIPRKANEQTMEKLLPIKTLIDEFLKEADLAGLEKQ